MFSHQNPVYASLLPIRAICRAHLILDFITRTILGEEYISLSSALCTCLHSPVKFSLLGPNILLSPLFSNTLSLRSSLNVGDQVSHPWKTTGTIIVPPYPLEFLLVHCVATCRPAHWGLTRARDVLSLGTSLTDQVVSRQMKTKKWHRTKGRKSRETEILWGALCFSLRWREQKTGCLGRFPGSPYSSFWKR